MGAIEIQLGGENPQGEWYAAIILWTILVLGDDKLLLLVAWPLKLRTSANKPKGYWLNLDNRRKFLLQFAEERGFDPSKLENWRQVNDELRKRVRFPLLELFESDHRANFWIG